MNPFHDRFVRFGLSLKDLSVPFVKKWMDGRRRAAIDLDRLEPVKETFVDESMKYVLTDVLFKAPYRESETYVDILIEHKSEGAARDSRIDLPFQLRYQEMMIMKHGWQGNKAGRYPRVYLYGLYHGNKSYSGPLSVGEKLDCPDWDIPNRWREPIKLIDLSRYSDEELMEPGKLGPFLLALKHAYDPDIMTVLRKMLSRLQAVEQEDNGSAFLVSLFTYLYGTAPPECRTEMEEIAIKSFTEETGGKIMTIAEQISKEAQAELIIQMIHNGMEKDEIQRVTNIDPRVLDELWRKHAS